MRRASSRQTMAAAPPALMTIMMGKGPGVLVGCIVVDVDVTVCVGGVAVPLVSLVVDCMGVISGDMVVGVDVFVGVLVAVLLEVLLVGVVACDVTGDIVFGEVFIVLAFSPLPDPFPLPAKQSLNKRADLWESTKHILKQYYNIFQFQGRQGRVIIREINKKRGNRRK